LTTAPQILVVDDNPAIRNLIRNVLEAAGYRVQTAQNGLDALHQFSECHAKLGLLLTDISMPYINGIALAGTLRRSIPDLPVLYISGGLDQYSALLGVSTTLPKPFTVAQLLERVKTLV
jgi:CheY-like chemotaxis protein